MKMPFPNENSGNLQVKFSLVRSFLLVPALIPVFSRNFLELIER